MLRFSDVLTPFVKSPQEYASEACTSTWNTRRWVAYEAPKGKFQRNQLPYRSPPSPQYVMYIRVRWYPSIEWAAPGNHDEPDLCEDIKINSDGGLNLNKINQLWGLENCVPIDPSRLKPFYAADPDKLSHMALKVLTEGQDCLRIIEQPRKVTRVLRAIRLAVLIAHDTVEYKLRCFSSNWQKNVMFRWAILVDCIIVAIVVAFAFFLMQKIWRTRKHPSLAYSIMAWWGIAMVVYAVLCSLGHLAKSTARMLTSEWDTEPAYLGPAMIEEETMGGKV